MIYLDIHIEFLHSIFEYTNTVILCILFCIFIEISRLTGSKSHIYGITNKPFELHSLNMNEGMHNFQTIKQNFNQKIKSLTISKDCLRAFTINTLIYNELKDISSRSIFIDKFNELIYEGETKSISIFMIDLDRFRTVNELYGRKVGNDIIIQTANRINSISKDKLILAREGEDEILLLLENLSETEMRQTGQIIIDLFKTPFVVNGQTIYITASIGISTYPTTSKDIEELIQQAEIATYYVKKNGRNNYHLFLPEDAVEVERKRRIEFALKEALIKNELYLVYQPKVRLKTGEICAVESLLRWKNEHLGLVPPSEFIPIAEESGIIIEIGYWVIYEAARQTKEWQNQGVYIQNAINVSALQFEDPFFVSRLKNILEIYELDPQVFIVEITESVMKDVNSASKVIKELHVLGIKVAIDDFGTGYSSLSVLNNIFIDIVKIDKAFIDHVATKKNTAALVKTILQMGESLDFQIVAEGIEDIKQATFLKENECEFGQGYYFSKPLYSSELLTLIKNKI